MLRRHISKADKRKWVRGARVERTSHPYAGCPLGTRGTIREPELDKDNPLGIMMQVSISAATGDSPSGSITEHGDTVWNRSWCKVVRRKEYKDVE